MSKGDKRPFTEVMPTAQHIVGVLGEYCQRIEIAGSLRRERPFVGDIEIVVIPQHEKNLFGIPDLSRNLLKNFLVQMDVKMPKCGDKYIQFMYGKFKVDLYMPLPETWGSIFMIRTGSHDFNMWMMNEWSGRVGMRFTDGRLVRRYDGTLVETPEESDVFTALELPLIPPTARDDRAWLPGRVRPVHSCGRWRQQKMCHVP